MHLKGSLNRVITLGLLLCLVGFNSFSQVESWDPNFSHAGFVRNTTILAKNVIGSPFYFEGCVQGSIYFENGEKKDSVCLNLDLYNHEIVVKQNISSFEYDLSLKLSSVEFLKLPTESKSNGSVFLKLKASDFKENAVTEKNFVFKKLGEGGWLIEVVNCELIEPDKGGYSIQRNPEFKKTTMFFVKNSNDKYEYWGTNKRKLSKIIGEEKYERLTKVMDSLKLSFKNLEEVASGMDLVNK